MELSLFKNRTHTLSALSFRILQAATLTLTLAIALPANAAGDRTLSSRIAPTYPELAKRMRVFGEVKIEATVDASGKVTDTKAILGNHMLAEAAEEALRRSRFEPGASQTTETVEYNFPRLP